MTNANCSIPLTKLTQSPFSLSLATDIKAKVKAKNLYGYGTESPQNSVGPSIQTVPGKMATPTRDTATTTTSLAVDWVAMTTSTETGGSSILSYHYEWDAGTNGVTYTEIYSGTTLTNAHTTSVSAGTMYKVRVRA